MKDKTKNRWLQLISISVLVAITPLTIWTQVLLNIVYA